MFENLKRSMDRAVSSSIGDPAEIRFHDGSRLQVTGYLHFERSVYDSEDSDLRLSGSMVRYAITTEQALDQVPGIKDRLQVGSKVFCIDHVLDDGEGGYEFELRLV